MPMKHDKGSPLWGAPGPERPGRAKVVVWAISGLALWAAIAVGAFLLAKAVT